MGKLKSRKAGVNVLNSVRKFIGGIRLGNKPVQAALSWVEGSLLEEVGYRVGLYPEIFMLLVLERLDMETNLFRILSKVQALYLRILKSLEIS